MPRIALALALLHALCVASLADTVAVAPGGDSTAAIQTAVNDASGPRTIVLQAGTHLVTAAGVNINKPDITLQGEGPASTLVQVSGTGPRFSLSATGAVIENLTLQKTDNTGVQNIIYIGASDATIRNNVIYGQYVIGDNDVSRAMEVAGGLSGLLIQGNEIYALRQPAYFNKSSGAITGNYVHGTKGWVVSDGSSLTFTDNTWGSGAGANYVDIAIIVDNPATPPPGFYGDIPGMSAANNGAVIEDQRSTPFVLSVVRVDDDAAAGGDGTITKPYQTITAALPRVVTGGQVLVAAGTYAENVVCRKSLTLAGAGCDATLWTGAAATDIPLRIQRDSAAPADITVEIRDLKFQTQQNQLIYASWNPSHAQALRLDIHACCFQHVNTDWDLYDGQDFGVYVHGANQVARAGTGAIRVYNNTFDTHGGVLFENCRAVDVLENEFTVLAEGIIFNYYSVAATYGEQLVQGNDVHLTSPDSEHGGLALNNWFGAPGTYQVLANVFRENTVRGEHVWWAMLYGVQAQQAYAHSHTMFNNSLDGALVVWGDYANEVQLDASGNWWGTNSPAALITGNVDYTPWLDRGEDLAPATPGFQGYFDTLWVSAACPQTGAAGRIEEALDLVTGSTIHLVPGLYEEQVVLATDDLHLIGSGAGDDPNADTIIRSPAGPLPYKFQTGTNWNYPVIGVHDCTGVSIENLRVDGYGRGNSNYRFIGIAFWNAGGSVADAFVTNIQNTPFSGAQHGVCIYAYNNTGGPYTLDVTDTTVTEYQKNGMALIGAGLTANLDGCTAAGKGAISTTAQNGIQISGGAGGTLTDCTISGHMYTGSGWASTGLLLSSAGAVSVSGADLSDNLPGLYCQDTSATFDDLTLANLDAASGDGFYAYNPSSAKANAVAPRVLASPVDGDAAGPDKDGRGDMTVTITNSTFTGHDAAYSWGLGAYGDNSGAVNLTITNSTVQNWDEGLIAYYDEVNGYTAPVTLTANDNRIVNNLSHGFNNLFPATIMDAKNNDWGSGEGPLNLVGVNETSADDCGAGSVNDMQNVLPTGALGNAVSENVDYCPWLRGASVELVPDQTCYAVGETVQVAIVLAGAPETIYAGQFWIQFNPAVLAWVGAAGVDPWDGFTLVNPNITPPADVKFVSVGDLSPTGGATAGTMALLTFQAIAEICGTADLVHFTDALPNQPPTRLTTGDGEVIPAQLDLEAIAIDQTAPVLSLTPADVTVECDAVPAPPTVTATDACDGVVPVTYVQTRADGLCAFSYTLTRVWSAVDACGNAVEHTQVITVQDTTAPVLTGCPATPLTVECDAVPAPALVTALDNCSGSVTVLYDEVRTDGACVDTYVLTRTWTATDDCGNTDFCTQIINVQDTTAPTFTASCPLPMITVYADAGLCTAAATTVNVPTPSATDNCDAAVDIVGVRSDSEPLTAPYPVGDTTITWTATDNCGNSTPCTQVVRVLAQSELVVDIAFNNAASSYDFTRCITFELTGAGTVAVPQTISFVAGAASGVTVLVPCGDYTCIRARDPLHTLWTADSDFAVVGTQYVARFTDKTGTGGADDRLVLGNLNQDPWIDVLDFGIYVVRFGQVFDLDTTCATTGRHPNLVDLVGSTIDLVDSSDFDQIAAHYLLRDETCALKADLGQPTTRIAVAALAPLGLADLARADLNHDGWLDAGDLAAFAAGALPQPLPAPDAGSELIEETPQAVELPTGAPAGGPAVKPTAGRR